jgi:hypothetical protein
LPAVVSATVAASDAVTVLRPQGTSADSGFECPPFEGSAIAFAGKMTEPARPAPKAAILPTSARRPLENEVKRSSVVSVLDR